MREYQHKYIVRTLLYSPVTIVILFLVIVLLLRSIMELNNKRITVSKLRDEALVAQSEVSADLARAQAKTADIKTEAGFDKYVRTTYPVVKKGEGVVVIYDDTKSPVVPVREDMTVWEKLVVFFKSRTNH